MNGLGHPIRVCTGHVAEMQCPHGCAGVELDALAELDSAAHDGCAVCHASPAAEPFQILRKCGHSRCYGRFHTTT